MLTFVLLTVILVLLTYIYLRWVQLKQYWAKRGVPHLHPNPLCGSMNFITKENPALWFRHMYNTFKEPYIGIWVFWRPGIIVNSPEIAKNILIRDQANFRNRFATSGTTDPVGSLNIFTLDDPLWSMIRKRLTAAFTSSKLRGVQNLLTQKSKELVERIQNDRQKNIQINLKDIMTDFSTDIIGTSSFGVVTHATLTGNCPLRTITEEFMRFSFYRGLAWCSAFFIPELVDLFRFKLFPLEATEFLRKILRTIIEQRGGLDNKITEPRDLLDVLIKIKQDCDSVSEIDFTENMMLAQATVFVQGGFDTTSSVSMFGLYELAFSPKIQEKLYEELQKAKDIHGDGLFDAAVLSKLTYLNCVINESLRKYPILCYMDRVALADYQIDDNVTIKAGCPVFVNAVGIHYDPDFYPEPETFNPDRFLPENEANLKPFTFLAFGEGPRKCIGIRLGLSTLRHGFAAVILNYELRPLPNSPVPMDVKLLRKGVLIAPEDAISVEFVPRK